jgi:hypothetical protein
VSDLGWPANSDAAQPTCKFKDPLRYLVLGACGGVFRVLLPAVIQLITLIWYRYPHPAFLVGGGMPIAMLVNAARIVIPYRATQVPGEGCLQEHGAIADWGAELLAVQMPRRVLFAVGGTNLLLVDGGHARGVVCARVVYATWARAGGGGVVLCSFHCVVFVAR